jgi:hypothetical protein
MSKLYLLAFMPMAMFSAQTVMAETIKNDPPALERKNSMPNATYVDKYAGPQVVVTRDSVDVTQGYDKNSKNDANKTTSPALKKGKGRILSAEDSK